MKYLLLITLLISTMTVLAQNEIELNPDGIIIPRTTSGAVSTPVEGMLIYDTSSNGFKYYDGSWKDIGSSFFNAINDGISYTAGNVAIGRTSTDAALWVENDGSQDLIRMFNSKGTQFRIFPSGAISIGSNWSSPIDDVIRLSGEKTLVSNTLEMEGGKVIMRASGSISFMEGIEERIRIDNNVNGDGRISTDELQINGGSDLAEFFDVNSSSDILPGMVVSIADDFGKLTLTSKKRDKQVVGIISGANGIKPGMFMGQKGSIANGEYPIAITGRVYVRTNAENGAIKSGDFLTSSSTSGEAMRVKKIKKSQGAIIGKALTPAKDGFVLVLVNLQ